MTLIKTKEQAQQYAIDYQQEVSYMNLTYGELMCFENKLLKLA